LDPLYQPPALLEPETSQPIVTSDDQPAKKMVNRGRRKFDLLPHLKYTLIFDEVADAEELNKIFVKTQDEHLLQEIVEEEKIVQKVCEEDEKIVQAQNPQEDEELA
jgi:hypothetical protein